MADRRSEVIAVLSTASSAKDAARRLHTSESTVYKWAGGELGREAARVAQDQLTERARRLGRRSAQLDARALGRELRSTVEPWILRYKGALS